jgi:UDP-N-acetylmuramoyl-tripeptide--D-alanyl-D-alanine ligase
MESNFKELYDLFISSNGVCTDTRKISPNCFFIALTGYNFDGNNFALESIKQGAKFAIVSDHTLVNNISIFFVKDTLLFLQEISNHHRKQFNIPIIGITGSNGKTTSKELIGTVLDTTFNTLYTKGNLNNHIGVPLTLLELNETHEMAVIEMGANKPGDIAELCAIAEPTHGIITNIGKAHLEGFGNLDGVFRTKVALFESIIKNEGQLIFNNDDLLIVSGTNDYSYVHTFGTDDRSDLKGKLIRMNPYVELQYVYKNYHSPELQTNMIGQYNFSNFLAAIRFGILFNIDFETINQAICNYKPSNNRSEIKKTARNILVMDAYNANPSSMKNAIESFVMMETQKDKLMILGDMLEMGNSEIEEHTRIIEQVIDLNLNTIFVGQAFLAAKQMNENLSFCKTREDASLILEHAKFKNTLILLKGSRGIGLEKLVDVL